MRKRPVGGRVKGGTEPAVEAGKCMALRVASERSTGAIESWDDCENSRWLSEAVRSGGVSTDEEEARENWDSGSDAEEEAVCEESLGALADATLVEPLLAEGGRRRCM